MKQLTKEQGIVLTGYTGVMCCSLADFHKDAEKRFDRSILSHEFGSKEMWIQVREIYKEDFLKLVGGES